jgi:hypothetical protein
MAAPAPPYAGPMAKGPSWLYVPALIVNLTKIHTTPIKVIIQYSELEQISPIGIPVFPIAHHDVHELNFQFQLRVVVLFEQVYNRCTSCVLVLPGRVGNQIDKDQERWYVQTLDLRNNLIDHISPSSDTPCHDVWNCSVRYPRNPEPLHRNSPAITSQRKQ